MWPRSRKSTFEEAMLAWPGEFGYEVAYASQIEPEKPAAERGSVQ